MAENSYLPTTVDPDALILAIENMDAAYRLRLHNVLLCLPFGGKAPAGFDWRQYIVSTNPGWAYQSQPSPSQRGTTLIWRLAMPEYAARCLWTLHWNYEGLLERWPWLTFDDMIATVLWAEEVGLWPNIRTT